VERVGALHEARARAALVAVAIAAAAIAARADVAGGATPSCAARPVVEQFFAALNNGDLASVDRLFAREDERWKWYSVTDRVGQRLGETSMSRTSLRSYFASRVRRHETVSLLSLREGGHGTFGLVLTRRADDLRDGRPVTRVGKGWVNCAVGKIAVWSLGGAPPPRTFGPCPTGTLMLTAADLPAAERAVLRSSTGATPRCPRGSTSPGGADRGFAACARQPTGVPGSREMRRSVQERTAIVEVRFPRVAPRERLASVAFYASRRQAGWVVWRLVP
jgi:limonene-1,2-epoxide hydrolase